MYVDISVVAFNGAQNRQFSYRYNSDTQLNIGSLVQIKFGKRTSLGVVRKLNTKKPHSSIKVSAIETVLPHRPLPEHLLDLADWMIQYYVSPASSVWQSILPKNPTTLPRKVFTKYQSKIIPLVQLSTKQRVALEEVSSSTKPVLLEGAMGSGKTEIYFHLIKRCLDHNKSTIFLMPEIFLTNQMIQRARKHFGDKLLVNHSGLTPAQRREVWDKCNSNFAYVVLGPRSALFSPLHNLGMIIIDECHEPSYKQGSSPRYLSEHVAAKIANMTKSKLVLGSATPSITTRYMADVGKITRVTLPERAISSAHPNIEIVDSAKSHEIFTKKLLDHLRNNLKNNQLSLLYVNRRGTAPIFLCQDCGYGFECPRCGSNLHFHGDSMKLVCHICNYQVNPPAKCPKCNSTSLRGIGIGTKAVVEQIKQIHPKVNIARVDRDNSKQNQVREILNKIHNHQIDVLVGTQMIGRGLDIENLHLVGIINADYDLMVVDYNSRERAFQLLTQTAGRAGRRETQGEVIIQTSMPKDKFFDYVKQNDFESFYQSELAMRKKYSYPPYSYLLKLECGFISPKLGKTKCDNLAKRLASQNNIKILGPVTAYPSIRARKHMWQIVLKCNNRKVLVEIAQSLEPFWNINLDPFGIL